MELEEVVKKINGKLDSGLDLVRTRLDSIERKQHSIFRKLPGPILYIAIGIATISGIKSCNQTKEILGNSQMAPQVQVENVIGNKVPERFYCLNGQRVYLEIDGKPVEQYIIER